MGRSRSLSGSGSVSVGGSSSRGSSSSCSSGDLLLLLLAALPLVPSEWWMHRRLRPRHSAHGSRVRELGVVPAGFCGLGRVEDVLCLEPQLGPPVHLRLRAWQSAHALVTRSRLTGVGG